VSEAEEIVDETSTWRDDDLASASVTSTTSARAVPANLDKKEEERKSPLLRVNLISPLLRAPPHANHTPSSSTPLTSPTTSFPPMAHERACSTIPKVVAFASRSFTSPFTVFSGLRPTQ